MRESTAIAGVKVDLPPHLQVLRETFNNASTERPAPVSDVPHAMKVSFVRRFFFLSV
jgi:hypothetical protein